MSWNLQKTLASDIYKATDLYEFARLCQFIDQTLRDVDSKTRNANRDEYEESGPVPRSSSNNQKSSNQESSRDQSNTPKPRFQTPASPRAVSQAPVGQINAFKCYNCEKPGHIVRRCFEPKKFNSNSFVREIEKDVFGNNDQNESKKE
jgi:hypothetical protein